MHSIIFFVRTRTYEGHAFAIYCIPSLDVLDGHEVLDDDRKEAETFFQNKIDVEQMIAAMLGERPPSLATPVKGNEELAEMSSRLDRLTHKLLTAEKEKEKVCIELGRAQDDAERYRDLMGRTNAEKLQHEGREAVLSAQYIRLSDEVSDTSMH